MERWATKAQSSLQIQLTDLVVLFMSSRSTRRRATTSKARFEWMSAGFAGFPFEFFFETLESMAALSIWVSHIVKTMILQAQKCVANNPPHCAADVRAGEA